MPIAIQSQGCGYCLSAHTTYESAYQCELKGLPAGPRLPKGSSIMFENEETFAGTRYSYLTKQGIVLYSFIGEVDARHVWIHVLDAGDFEAVVLPGQFNSYCCPSYHKYHNGYASSLEAYHMQFNLLYPIHF